MVTAAQRVAEAYAQHEGALDEQQLRHRASSHRPDPQMERALQLERTDPDAFRRLGSSLCTAAGHYAETKAAAEQVAALDATD